ncbi:hypothetical protein [Sphingomonas sp. IW22]|uniref:hypothetical protein n=1 Tax=Sphingomonas sp. IW22 TaxID=3242489 RepID=UPI00352245DC
MEPQPLPQPDPAPSLAERVGALIGGADDAPSPRRGGAIRLAIMLALLLPAGPLLTIAAAEWWTVRTRAVMVAQADSPAARDAAAQQAERRELARLGGTSFAGAIDRIARLLPPEDRLATAELSIDGEAPAQLGAEIATIDPDRLRAALARDSSTGALRVEGERQGDGVMIVTVAGGRP